MKHLLTILLLLPLLSFGQSDTCTTYTQDDTSTYADYLGSYRFNNLQIAPYHQFNKCKDSTGWIIYNPSDSTLKVWRGHTWVTVGASAGDSILIAWDSLYAHNLRLLALEQAGYITAAQARIIAHDTANAFTGGTGISISAAHVVTNTAPDQTVVLSNGPGISVTGTYPNFTITNSSPSSGGTITSITYSSPLAGGTITASGTVSIPAATSSVDGYLSHTDWTTFNSKGSGTVTSISAGSGLSGGTITTTGTISMPVTGTPGTYGDATHIPSITTDAQGRVTGVTTYTVSAGGSTSVTAPITNSGTSTNPNIGITYSTTPTPSTIPAWDAHKGFSANNFNPSTVYIVSANSSSTLTVDSPQVHVITGSTAGQIFRLPVTSTLVDPHQRYEFDNTHNSQSISIKGAAGLSGFTVLTGSNAVLTCIGTTGASGTGEWSLSQPITNTSVPGGDLGGTFPNNLTLINIGAAGTYGSATAIPQFTTDANGRVTSVTTLTATPAFSSVTGNISTSQMNSGTNASSSTFFRGDGTWSSAVQSIASSGSPSAYVTGAGSTSEKNGTDIVIPANAISANGCLIIYIDYDYVGIAGAKTLVIRAGTNANSITDAQIQSNATVASALYYGIENLRVCNQGATNSQLWKPSPIGGQAAAARVSTSIDTTSSWRIHLNGILANSGDQWRVGTYITTVAIP